MVPTLVFVDRTRWLASDFMQQLRNADFADGKTIDIESPADEEPEAFYGGCLFTHPDLGLYRLNAARFISSISGEIQRPRERLSAVGGIP